MAKNTNKQPTVRFSILAAALLASISSPSKASIGVIPLGFGSDSIAMAGTDIGYSHDPLSINNNTAGIAKSTTSQLSTVIEPYFMTHIRHADSLNSMQASSNDLTAFLSIGWTTPLEKAPDITIGLGVFAQGGIGYEYKNLNTTFGNQDELSALIGVFRMAPAIAWRVNDKLRIGFSASVNYSQAEQQVFPNTSDAETGFAGLHIKDLSGISYAWRAGIQYDVSNALTLGLAYGSDTKLALQNGSAVVNFEAMGLGRVKYNSAEIDGLKLPKELGIGFAWQATPQLSIGGDLNWYSWSEALGNVTTQLSNTETANAPNEIIVSTDFGGQDQFASSIGAQFQLNERTQITAGINHAGNVIKHGNESTLNNLLAKWHISAGANHQLSEKWKASLAYVYIPIMSRKYTNTQFPIGDDAEETFGGYSIAFGISCQW
ncbi:Uncharacterised protein [Zhongshania aliphaticivorans]|uniref:Aromatic hydrocarbon degradation protein n=1 Tax=Zhongshania aliphaticivorans TaxID=1470434 RepID=A0A5S9P268_9GAMM|nr:outer membrane protein transport protein [Zhongshania aliphaticivorans]CAA0090051.1 Uncharacterised protein [Zhongshania aliphaticivorans]CAA0097304.1 Uncharacterised protein [Zhongshania aliphaticivorans]